MTILKAISFSLLILCFSNDLHAQERPELFSQIEQVLREREPSWRIERITPGAASDPVRQSIVLRSGKNRAAVDVAVWRQEKDAADVFAAESLSLNNKAGKKMSRGELAGLGDENYIWSSVRSGAWPTLKFRKGNVNVTVFAPSVRVARRLAQHVIERIDAN
jgi:hypothetical protein